MSHIGFIQGRLSPIIDGKIQCFPWGFWEDEFKEASRIGIRKIEWTIDQEGLYENPLMTSGGQGLIKKRMEENNVLIPSATGDCFMQSPFWKYSGKEAEELQKDFMSICEACSLLGITYLVVPLVDNGAIENRGQEDLLVSFLVKVSSKLKDLKIKIVFESDFCPSDLSRLIERFPEDIFGINYDIGNSAALGYSPEEEFLYYGKRILNVHVKDRLLGGSTVELGQGSAKFDVVFKELKKVNYKGNYILQTARAKEGNHSEMLCKYEKMTQGWISEYEL